MFQCLNTSVCLLFLSAFLQISHAETSVQANRTFEVSLSNGLKVIIREDHRAPMVMTQP